MPTLTGRNIRTITGYVANLLDYPRWVIEREVDFTHCHLRGHFESEDSRCTRCQFGTACSWLNANRAPPSPDAPLGELMQALRAAVEFMRASTVQQGRHAADCDCDTCLWLNDAKSFLRMQRHRS